MKDVVIVSAARTPIGKYAGAFAHTPAVDLGAAAISAAIKRAGIEAEQVSEVLMGCVIQAGLGQNVARQAAVKAGIPVRSPATTLNSVCGSSLKAVNMAAALIQAGQAEVVVAGGMENMSMAPYVLPSMRFGTYMNDCSAKDAMISDSLWCAFEDCHMGLTAENIADEYKISREEQDAFAVDSQQKCERARKAGLFADETVPVEVKQKKQTVIVDADEFPRDGVTIESIMKLRPAFKTGGTVTAANSSGINDGASAVILMSVEKADQLGIQPLARWINGVSVGLEPRVMGLGAGIAANELLMREHLSIDDLTLIEANEAFASQSIASARLAGWDKCPEKVNVNGGAIALGHPVGCSGCRILVTLLYELKRRGGGKGLATLCVGGGQGTATIVDVY